MRRGIPVLAAVGLVVAAALAVTGAVPAEPAERALSPSSFAFAIGNGTLDGNPGAVGSRYARFDLVVVDGEEAKAGEVEAIEAGGAVVLAYLSVGTVEKWRGWYPRLKRYRLKAWRDWKDEWYADASKAGYRDELVAIAGDEILDKGFDGLFLDNTDMVETRSHRRQRKGMGKLVAGLDELVDADGRLLFTQNGAPGMLEGYGDAVDPLIGHFDGWNREDVSWTYDFDRRRYVRNRNGDRSEALAELDRIHTAGLVTTATDYVGLTNQSTGAECESVANAEGVDALDYVADIGLTKRAVAANPPDC
ncbi:MAG: endo alpha-1,4 polygalactosaminidase [bacterium]